MENVEDVHAQGSKPAQPILTIMPWLSVSRAADAVSFYRVAFGATTGEVAEFDGTVQVAELLMGGATFWVQQDDDLPADADPGRTARMIITVPDPAESLATAVRAGATELAALHDDNGWLTCRLVDPFGHQWEFARRSR